MEIAGNVALVVGGTSGLGLATARRLRSAGARVVVTGRDPERAAKAVAELGGDPSASDCALARSAGGTVFGPVIGSAESEVLAVLGDVTVTEDVSRAVHLAVHLGRLASVVYCAGDGSLGRVVGRSGPLPLADFERVVRAHLVGAFDVVRLGAHAMAANDCVEGERGVVIFTSSIAAFDGTAGQAAYAAAKAGLVGMTLPLARDLARHAIRVVTLAPGLFATPMFDTLPEATRTELVGRVPHPRRLGHPDEFAALVAHVVANPMLNGEVIRLDGATRL